MLFEENSFLIPADDCDFFYLKGRSTNIGKKTETRNLRITLKLMYKVNNELQLVPDLVTTMSHPVVDKDNQKQIIVKFIEDKKENIRDGLLLKLQEKDTKLHAELTKHNQYGQTFREFIDENIDAIARFFSWDTETKKSYYRTLKNQFAPLLRSCPMNKLTEEDYVNAYKQLERSFCARTKAEEYSRERSRHLMSNLYCVAEYAVEEGICQTNPVRNLTKEYDRLNPMESIRKYQHRRKSLSIQATFEAMELLIGHIDIHGETLGTCLQLMAGLRPGEACGVTFRDVIYFKEKPDRCYIRVYTQVRPISDDIYGIHTIRLKTQNGYRFIPVVKSLQTLIEKKKDYLLRIEYTEEQITAMPLVHSNLVSRLNVTNPNTNPCNYRCSPSRLSEYSKEILYKAVKGHMRLEVPHSESGIAEDGEDLSRTHGNSDPIEYDPESYELRRNFATVLFGICAMTPPDVQYLMGHKLEYDSYGRATDYANEDKLLALLDQMDCAVGFMYPVPTDKRLEIKTQAIKPAESITLKLSDEIVQRLSIQPQSEKSRIRIKVCLHAIEPDDPIHISIHSDGVLKGSISPDSAFRNEAKKTTNVLAKYYDVIYRNQPVDDAPDEETDDGIYKDEELNVLERQNDEICRQAESRTYYKQTKENWRHYLKNQQPDNEDEDDN